MKNIPYYLTIVVAFLAGSCAKEVTPTIDSTVMATTDTSEVNYTSEYAYNLNVIYFVTQDRVANPDYEERLSEILLEMQDFYGTWMQHWGYGDRSFGLLKDVANNRIKIHLVNGSKPAADYPYEGGNGPTNAKADIDAYFAANPGAKSSDHNLIIFAVNELLDQGEDMAVGVPFYGIGKDAYALDYPGMDVANIGMSGLVGSVATTWIGGMAHELGHGLNLPHCGETVSQVADNNYGISLMGGGNLTYQKDTTFLTHSSAAILNNCQVFSKVQATFYSTSTSKIEELQASYEGGDIVISGKFSSDVPVEDVTYYHRPTNNAGGYTAMTWVSKPENDEFSIRMPISEFREKGDQAYAFDIILNLSNGNNNWNSYSYKFVNDVPAIDFGDKDDYDKSAWEVIDFSSEETDANYAGLAASIIDNSITTYWHSMWSQYTSTHPHHVTVDMKTAIEVGGFSFWQRQGTAVGTSDDIVVEVSNNNSTWETLIDTALQNSSGRPNIGFSPKKIFRYFRYIVNSSYGTDEKNASLAELGVYK